ncbi:MAG: gene transfer agent family protein [Parvibaculaceae bacterium]
MPNRMRGEVEARLGGKSYTLCLTLGAIAELESALGAPDILALAERFEAGRLSAGDAIRILGAGLRGGGNAVTDAEVAALPIEGGAVGALHVVGALLKATFGGEEEPPGNRQAPPAGSTGGA